jgi:hypothetical protein
MTSDRQVFLNDDGSGSVYLQRMRSTWGWRVDGYMMS